MIAVGLAKKAVRPLFHSSYRSKKHERLAQLSMLMPLNALPQGEIESLDNLKQP
jgi:hypothetical protein